MSSPALSPLHVVFGAGGPLGNTLSRLLAAQGHRVRAVNRRGEANLPIGIEVVRADATDPVSARAACEGASVVYHTANAPYTEWATTLPRIMNGLIDAAAHTGAKLVYADNLYGYGECDRALTEDMPLAATGPKGHTRADVARRLMKAHQAGKLRATIARASDFFGPEVLLSGVGERVFGNALRGKKVDLLGDIDQPHTLTFIEDFARALTILGERNEALGEVWHVPSASTITTREFVSILFAELNQNPGIQVAPSWLLAIVGLFNPMVREVRETLYQWEKPFIADASKFEHAFGRETTPMPSAIRATLAWYRQHQSTAPAAQ